MSNLCQVFISNIPLGQVTLVQMIFVQIILGQMICTLFNFISFYSLTLLALSMCFQKLLFHILKSVHNQVHWQVLKLTECSNILENTIDNIKS